MYLLDTNFISERRKGQKANRGVIEFWGNILRNEDYLPAQAVGELQRGVELLRQRNDLVQAAILAEWLDGILIEYQNRILAFHVEAATIWGRLLVPHKHDLIDKQIAAMALLYDFTVVTRNVEHFRETGARVLNPWTAET